jgi:hypothetical protein
MGEIWSKAISVVSQNGFIPTATLEKIPSKDVLKRGPKDKVTLFEIIRLASGVEWSHREWSDVSFWNWVELRDGWRTVWDALDNGLRSTGVLKQNALVWAFDTERSQTEILNLLSICQDTFPEIEVAVPSPRPEARLMVGQGKMPAALANSFAVLRHDTGLSYGDILSSTNQNVSSDEELLKKIDGLLRIPKGNLAQTENQSLIPRLLVRCKAEIERSEELESMPFTSFISKIDDISNLEGVSDFALQRRLAQLAPEKNASARRILENSTTQ